MSYTNSIILGSSQDSKLQTAEGYQHILLLAPHGSGKGVAFVLPTLLSLDESCIVHDIKLENYQLTSGYRAKEGHKIFVFNPLGDKTHRYNPLDFMSLSGIGLTPSPLGEDFSTMRVWNIAAVHIAYTI